MFCKANICKEVYNQNKYDYYVMELLLFFFNETIMQIWVGNCKLELRKIFKLLHNIKCSFGLSADSSCYYFVQNDSMKTQILKKLQIKKNTF